MFALQGAQALLDFDNNEKILNPNTLPLQCDLLKLPQKESLRRNTLRLCVCPYVFVCVRVYLCACVRAHMNKRYTLCVCVCT